MLERLGVNHPRRPPITQPAMSPPSWSPTNLPAPFGPTPATRIDVRFFPPAPWGELQDPARRHPCFVTTPPLGRRRQCLFVRAGLGRHPRPSGRRPNPQDLGAGVPNRPGLISNGRTSIRASRSNFAAQQAHQLRPALRNADLPAQAIAAAPINDYIGRPPIANPLDPSTGSLAAAETPPIMSWRCFERKIEPSCRSTRSSPAKVVVGRAFRGYRHGTRRRVFDGAPGAGQPTVTISETPQSQPAAAVRAGRARPVVVPRSRIGFFRGRPSALRGQEMRVPAAASSDGSEIRSGIGPTPISSPFLQRSAPGAPNPA